MPTRSEPSVKGHIEPKYYAPEEERINVLSHAFALLLSIVGLLALISRALLYGNTMHLVGFSAFALSLIALFTASTAYHSVITSYSIHYTKLYDYLAGNYSCSMHYCRSSSYVYPRY